MQDKIFLHGLQVKCKIGIFDWERKVRQKILIDLEFPTRAKKAARGDRIKDAVDYKRAAKHIIRFVSASEFYLLETLAEKLARSILSTFPIQKITLRVSKPGAIRGARNVGVQITRKNR